VAGCDLLVGLKLFLQPVVVVAVTSRSRRLRPTLDLR
jgi:hypothetical protein